MSVEPKCPKCACEYTYADGNMWICPECSNEWSQHQSEAQIEDVQQPDGVKDANGNTLQDGDSVTVIKELRIKGASSVVKVGTKVKNIRLIDPIDGHDIACKIDGIGAINLKSEYVRKA